MSPDPREGLAETGAATSDILVYRRLLAEAARRQIEALRLYEPLEGQDVFHRSKARRRLLRAGNRAGKTLVCAVETARALTGRDPYRKFPTEGGRCYAVGKDESQLGEVLHRKLFRAGAFKIIRDRETGVWRAFRPWDAEDMDREGAAKPAPPLIPNRYVKDRAWVKKAAGIPEKFVLTNGWEIDFWSSKAEPPRGADIDIVWMDEEIVNPEWYAEMAARLLDRKGSLWWGATPQSGSTAMYDFHHRCEQEEEEWKKAGFDPAKEPDYREIVISLADNPHLGQREKDLLASDLTEEQARVRIDGEYAVLGRIMYPEFDLRCHDAPKFPIPHDWTRYAVTDPGRQVCAVLFAAVPPIGATFPVGRDPVTGVDRTATVRENGEFLLLYDELYINQCDAAKYGERMREKCAEQRFHAFLIDRHGSRLTDMGNGRDVEGQYRDALKANKVRSTNTGHGFQWASDDVQGGIESVRAYLRVRQATALPRVFTVDGKNRLPCFLWEIARYSRKVDPAGNITDEPETRGRVHQMANLRYICAARPKYHAPPKGDPIHDFAYKRFLDKQARKRGGSAGVILGPDRR